MNYNYYEVRMRGCTKYVTAFNELEATILAQAEAIHDRKDYELHSINMITSELYWELKNKQYKEYMKV